MDPIVFLIVAAAVILIVIAVGLRVRSGEPSEGGPYSSSAQATGDFAAFGTSVDDVGHHGGLRGGHHGDHHGGLDGGGAGGPDNAAGGGS